MLAIESDDMLTRTCPVCGKKYKVKVSWQKACSTPCRLALWAKSKEKK